MDHIPVPVQYKYGTGLHTYVLVLEPRYIQYIPVYTDVYSVLVYTQYYYGYPVSP